jgi:hypothetical protein
VLNIFSAVRLKLCRRATQTKVSRNLRFMAVLVVGVHCFSTENRGGGAVIVTPEFVAGGIKFSYA